MGSGLDVGCIYGRFWIVIGVWVAYRISSFMASLNFYHRLVWLLALNVLDSRGPIRRLGSGYSCRYGSYGRVRWLSVRNRIPFFVVMADVVRVDMFVVVVDGLSRWRLIDTLPARCSRFPMFRFRPMLVSSPPLVTRNSCRPWRAGLFYREWCC